VPRCTTLTTVRCFAVTRSQFINKCAAGLSSDVQRLVVYQQVRCVALLARSLPHVS
jgi:hypothetical protein